VSQCLSTLFSTTALTSPTSWLAPLQTTAAAAPVSLIHPSSHTHPSLVSAQGTPVGAQGTPVGAQGTPVGAQGTSVGAQGTPVVAPAASERLDDVAAELLLPAVTQALATAIAAVHTAACAQFKRGLLPDALLRQQEQHGLSSLQVCVCSCCAMHS